jgi:hypothetical protein
MSPKSARRSRIDGTHGTQVPMIRRKGLARRRKQLAKASKRANR